MPGRYRISAEAIVQSSQVVIKKASFLKYSVFKNIVDKHISICYYNFIDKMFR